MSYKQALLTAAAYNLTVVCAFTYLMIHFDKWWLVLVSIPFVVKPVEEYKNKGD